MSFSHWFILMLMTIVWDFFPSQTDVRVRVDMSTYRGSCQCAFQGYLCILEWVTSAGMLMLKDRGSFSAYLCVCVHSRPCAFVGPVRRKSPACQGSRSGWDASCKNVNNTENEVEVSALMDSFGNCHCVKINLLEWDQERARWLIIRIN